MNKKFHVKIPQNENGRDFVIGDIHAHKKRFFAALESVNFDKEKDRLFAIGDLVDRGKYPLEILDALREPWFFSTIGNHEQLIFNRFEFPATKGIYTSTVRTQRDAAELHRHNGGKWFCKLYKSAQENIYHALKKLPYAITLETEQGNIGLVHAEVPDFLNSWNELIEGLEEGDEKLKEEIIWGRDAISEFYDIHRFKKWEKGVPVEDRWIKDIALTVHGHTGVHEPQVHGNQIWIDTGHTTAALTILEVYELFDLIEENKK